MRVLSRLVALQSRSMENVSKVVWRKSDGPPSCAETDMTERQLDQWPAGVMESHGEFQGDSRTSPVRFSD